MDSRFCYPLRCRKPSADMRLCCPDPQYNGCENIQPGTYTFTSPNSPIPVPIRSTTKTGMDNDRTVQCQIYNLIPKGKPQCNQCYC